MNYKNSVQLYSCTTGTVQIPEYNESILTLNAWRLPEGTACMATAGSRNRYYPQPHLAQGSARIFGTSERYSLWYLDPDSAMGTQDSEFDLRLFIRHSND